MASEHLGDKLSRLRRIADLTQEGLAERSGVCVDVVRKLEQKRKGSARLPTLHALAEGLGVELTTLLGDPPGVPSTGEADPPQLVAVRRAIHPLMFAPPLESDGVEVLTPSLLRAEIAYAWSMYHSAEFPQLLKLLPGILADARLTASQEQSEGQAALGKAYQLAGHLSIRLNKLDLALAALERAIAAAEVSGDPLLVPMICNSLAWAYQRSNRLDDARSIALHAAHGMEQDGLIDDAPGLRVWGGLTMSAATSYARLDEYDEADKMMRAAEKAAGRLAKLPPTEGDGRLLSVFSKSSVLQRVIRPHRTRTPGRAARAAGRGAAPGQRHAPVEGHTPVVANLAPSRCGTGSHRRGQRRGRGQGTGIASTSRAHLDAAAHSRRCHRQ